MRPTMIAVLFPAAVLVACNGDKSSDGEDTAAECQVSVANAGFDKSAPLGSEISLSGADSAICEKYRTAETASFAWSFDLVPVDSRLGNNAFSVNGSSDAISTGFTPDVVGDYVVSLVVTDPSGTSNADLLVVTVGGGNAAPVAWCAGDVASRTDERVELDGTGSFDPEGADLVYSWTLATTPDCSLLTVTDLYNADSATPSLSPDCEGIYLASLVVSDGESWSDPDYCIVNVSNGNRLPEAEAGPSMALPYCTDNPITLNGWASYDLDNDALTYLWSVVDVPEGSTVDGSSLSDPASAEPTLAWDLPGTYTFELQVHDGTIWSAPDQVSYMIATASTNRTPIANGGADQRVDAIGECSSTSYVWSCLDCPETSVLIDGAATSDPDGDPLTYRWTADSRVVSFSNNASAITDMIFPPQGASFGSASEMEVEATLTARDCEFSDTDTVLVTYTCTGEYTGE